MACYLARWRVLDAGVGVELPDALRDRAVGACFDFLPIFFDTALVDWAAFGFFCVRGCAGDDWGLVVRAERLLPRGVVGSWCARPAVCVSCTDTSIDGALTPRSRAIAVIRVLSITIPYRA